MATDEKPQDEDEEEINAQDAEPCSEGFKAILNFFLAEAAMDTIRENDIAQIKKMPCTQPVPNSDDFVITLHHVKDADFAKKSEVDI